MLTAGCENDCQSFDRFDLNLPQGSIIYADSMYTKYEIEDLLLETSEIKLNSQLKANSKRQRSGCVDYIIQVLRKKIETGFSMLTNLFPKKIHVTTDKGFALKCAFLLQHLVIDSVLFNRSQLELIRSNMC